MIYLIYKAGCKKIYKFLTKRNNKYNTSSNTFGNVLSFIRAFSIFLKVFTDLVGAAFLDELLNDDSPKFLNMSSI